MLCLLLFNLINIKYYWKEEYDRPVIIAYINSKFILLKINTILFSNNRYNKDEDFPNYRPTNLHNIPNKLPILPPERTTSANHLLQMPKITRLQSRGPWDALYTILNR